MKLIFLYGPPASGKLTVARVLAQITGYKIFHNHLTADLVSSVFPFGTREYSDLAERVRLDVTAAVVKSNIKGVIVTFAYGGETYHGENDDRFIKKVVRVARRHGARVLFVKLFCDERELRRRVKHPSRKVFAKIHKVSVLKTVMRVLSLDSVIPFVESQIIDTTRLSPHKAATLIKRHYKL